jgi:hypothetical protein
VQQKAGRHAWRPLSWSRGSRRPTEGRYERFPKIRSIHMQRDKTTSPLETGHSFQTSSGWNSAMTIRRFFWRVQLLRDIVVLCMLCCVHVYVYWCVQKLYLWIPLLVLLLTMPSSEHRSKTQISLKLFRAQTRFNKLLLSGPIPSQVVVLTHHL